VNRRLALAAISVVVVLCVVGASIAAVAAGGRSMAYSVNGTRVTQQTVDDQLDDLANTDATAQASRTKGSIDSSATAQILTTNIALDLLRAAAERRGVTVTADDRAEAKSAVGDQLKGYPQSYVDLVIELRSLATALGLADDDAINTFIVSQFRKADVVVNPKYGFWNPRVGVCAPSGCPSAGG
jgi:hypothetical protein